MKKALHFRNQRKGFTMITALMASVLVVGVAAIAAPMVMFQLKKASMTEAISHGRMISQGLIIFDHDYGNFPDEVTAKMINDLNEDAANTKLHGSANDYLRQLIASGTIDSEQLFFVKDRITKQPDDKIKRNEALSKGENGFSYLLKKDNTGHSTASNVQLPMLITSAKTADGKLTFNKSAWNNKAIILRLNCAAEVFSISEDGTLPAENLYPGDQATREKLRNSTKFVFPDR